MKTANQLRKDIKQIRQTSGPLVNMISTLASGQVLDAVTVTELHRLAKKLAGDVMEAMWDTDRREQVEKWLQGYKPTEAEKREQAISFAYGNASMSNPNITREMVAEIYDKRRKDEDQG